MENKYFKLRPTWGNKWYWGKIITQIPRKYKANSMKGFTGTIKMEVVMGTTPGDFFWNSGSELVISEKVLDIWKPFKKFEIYNIEVVNAKIPFNYFGVSIHGNGGPLDKSRTIVKYDDDGGHRKSICGMKGLYFFENKWDKSDIFTLGRFRGFSLVTERVVKAMKKAKVTNCKYTPIEEFEFGYIEENNLMSTSKS